MNLIESIPLSWDGASFFIESWPRIEPDEGSEYVAILKSDLDRLNETEKWRQLQAQLLSVQESTLTSEHNRPKPKHNAKDLHKILSGL